MSGAVPLALILSGQIELLDRMKTQAYCEAESTDPRVGELLRDRKHEGVHEWIRPMDVPQSPGRDCQAVEVTEGHLQESGKAESNRRMRIHRRGDFQSCKLPSGMVPEVRHGCSELRVESEDSRAQNKGPAGFGRSFGVLLCKMYLNDLF